MLPITVTKTPIPLGDQDDAILLLLGREEPGGAAFRTLYDRYRERVFGFLVRLVRDPALAEDLLQETFFRVYQKADTFKPAYPFRPWLFRIARNAALNVLRKRRRVHTDLDQVERAPTASGAVVEEVTLREQVARIGVALDDLPDETRALLIQHHYLGLKPAELAESWGCTERTIRNRLQAAVDLLTRTLQTQGGEA